MPNDPAELDFSQANARGRSAPFRRPPTPRSTHRDKNANFILAGFHEEHGIRRYVFQSANDDGASGEFTVEADIGLARKYGIGLQELPLLCRNLVGKQDSVPSTNALAFSEDLMKEHADQRVALKEAALQKKKKTYRNFRPANLRQDHP